MRVKSHTKQMERRILTAMVMDDTALGGIASRWEHEGLFKSKWSNLIGGWCVAFYKKYEKAPRKAITGLFTEWAVKHQDEETITIVEKFLVELSNEHDLSKEKLNGWYELDKAGEYFTSIKQQKLAEVIQDNIDAKKIDNAIANYSKVELGNTSWVDVFTDKQAISSMFKTQEETLVEYRGPLGDLFRGVFQRGKLVCFEGVEKRGKSFWLQDLAWRILENRFKVAYFMIGDMDQDETMERFATRTARRPLQKGVYYHPLEIKMKGRRPKITQKKKMIYRTSLSEFDVKQIMRDFLRGELKQRNSPLKLQCHPSDTLTVDQIKFEVERLCKFEWVPDAIIIDYADLLSPPHGIKEFRHQTDKSWKQLRSLSQEFHCLVATATQANAKAYDAEYITRKHSSEDKRKNAHVNTMIGLTATIDEEAKGIIGVNIAVTRKGRMRSSRKVYVAMCLPIANPCLKSV